LNFDLPNNLRFNFISNSLFLQCFEATDKISLYIFNKMNLAVASLINKFHYFKVLFSAINNQVCLKLDLWDDNWLFKLKIALFEEAIALRDIGLRIFRKRHFCLKTLESFETFTRILLKILVIWYQALCLRLFTHLLLILRLFIQKKFFYSTHFPFKKFKLFIDLISRIFGLFWFNHRWWRRMKRFFFIIIV
jgi:hypothetical protein